MLTITGLIAKALAAQSPKLVVLARITDQDANDFYFMSGAHRPNLTTYLDYVQNIHAVSPVSPQIDPISRAAQSSSETVTMVDDGVIREIMQTQPLKNATMTLRLTTADDTAGSSIGLWKGIIHDVTPTPGFIEFQCRDVLSEAFVLHHYGLVMNRHPLELITELLDAADIPTGFRDTTSLDPDTDTAISHFIAANPWTAAHTDQTAPADVAGTISGLIGVLTSTNSDPRYSSNSSEEDAAGIGVDNVSSIHELAFMMNGGIWADEDGEVKFKRFDATASVVATWTSEDILSLRQTSTYDNMINEVHVTLGAGTEVEATYIHRDTDSQAEYNLVGGTANKKELKLTLAYSCQRLALTSGVDSSQTAGWDVREMNLSGMCGTRVSSGFREQAAGTVFGDVKPFTQPAAATLSASRKLHIQADGEIISATGQAFVADEAWGLGDVDRYGEPLTTVSFYPVRSTLSGVTRAVGGAGEAHDTDGLTAPPMYDVTVAKYLASAIVERAANGIPILEVETSFAQYAVQVGDLVDLEDDFPLWWGVDGVDSTNQIKWEVIGKEADPLGSSDRIRWRLAYAAINTPSWTTSAEDDPIDPEYQRNATGIPGFETFNIATSLAKNVWVKVNLGGPNLEIGTGFDATTDDYTAPTDGIYRIHARCRVLSLDIGARAEIAIFINAAFSMQGLSVYNDSAAARDTDIEVSWHNAILSAGDVVDFRVRQTGSATLTLSTTSGHSTYSVQLIG